MYREKILGVSLDFQIFWSKEKLKHSIDRTDPLKKSRNCDRRDQWLSLRKITLSAEEGTDVLTIGTCPKHHSTLIYIEANSRSKGQNLIVLAGKTFH